MMCVSTTERSGSRRRGWWRTACGIVVRGWGRAVSHQNRGGAAGRCWGGASTAQWMVATELEVGARLRVAARVGGAAAVIMTGRMVVVVER